MSTLPGPSAFAKLRARLRVPEGSSFVRNALTLVSATVLTQAISAVSAPVLSRLYEPEAYGALGLVMSVTGLCGVFSTFQYSRAILLPAEQHDGMRLTQLSGLLAVVVSILLVGPSILLRVPLAKLLSTPSLVIWLPLVPLSVLIGGLSGALNGWANRRERYGVMSKSRVYGVLAGLAVSLAGAFVLPPPWGLLGGYIIGQLATLLVLLISSLREEGMSLFQLDGHEIRAIARQHRGFAAYSTPTEFINVFVAQAPVLLLTTFVGPAAVGLFNMTNRLLGLPNTFIAGAVGEVFQQRASSDYATAGTCRPIYVKTARALALSGAIPMLILAFAAPTIFALYLGEKWRGAGDYARALAAMNFLRLVVSPISYVFYIAGKQREDMLAHLAMIVLILGSMYLSNAAGASHLWLIATYSAAYSLVYVYYGIRGYQMSQRDDPDAVA